MIVNEVSFATVKGWFSVLEGVLKGVLKGILKGWFSVLKGQDSRGQTVRVIATYCCLRKLLDTSIMIFVTTRVSKFNVLREKRATKSSNKL